MQLIQVLEGGVGTPIKSDTGAHYKFEKAPLLGTRIFFYECHENSFSLQIARYQLWNSNTVYFSPVPKSLPEDIYPNMSTNTIVILRKHPKLCQTKKSPPPGEEGGLCWSKGLIKEWNM